MQQRKQLAAIFSPTRRLAGAEPTLVRTGGMFGGVQWVVPRADIHYRRIDFGNLPARQRPAAARIAARRHEPRAGAQFHIAWTGPVAHVWTWADGDPAVAAGDATWIPESLLRAAPAGDGVRLLAQVRGVEGQSWRGGILHASQWWPDIPSAEQWQRFVRGCGLGPEAGNPEPQPEATGWSEPWGDPQRGLPASPAMLERWAWVAGIAVLAFAMGWQLIGLLEWSLAQSRLDARMQALREQAAPLLAARERADRARDELLALQDLQAGHSDYKLMADVIEPLPEDARFASWVREDTRLQATVTSADADPRHFVSAYDGKPLLEGVVATPAEGGMVLAFDLAAQPEQAP
ncbi:MAG: hypothetical protein M3Y70_08910 [Pseudomonadota bacterium]|nr:hypothetical protein [Pseudomonadota bacterium]